MKKVVLLLLMFCFLMVGCKGGCPICDQYEKAVKECVKENPPSADELAKHKENCQVACEKKEAATTREEKHQISERLMQKESCVLEYEGGGCEAFNKCLAKVEGGQK